jgi:hypothetical protein
VRQPRVKDVVEVSGVTDPDSERFVCSGRQLRKLLAEEIDEDAAFE